MTKIAYLHVIALWAKAALDFKQITTKPVGDLVELYTDSPSLGHGMLIGKIKVEPKFMEFLKEGGHTNKVFPPDKVDSYFRIGSFQIDNTPENATALAAVTENFDITKKLQADDAIKYIDERRPQNSIYSASFRTKELGLPNHDETLKQYKAWLQRQQAQQAQPVQNPEPAI
jgi:hypothetical protein